MSAIPASEPELVMTEAEYLAFEETSDTKHEFVDGHVYDWPGYEYDAQGLAGARLRHNRLQINLVTSLAGPAAAAGCQVGGSDLRLRVRLVRRGRATHRYYYPDAMVLCDAADLRDDEATAVSRPCLVVEILSGRSGRIDRTEKLEIYQGIPSVQAYLIVHQRERRLEHHWRDADGTWQMEVITRGSVPIPCIGFDLPLEAIYVGVADDRQAADDHDQHRLLARAAADVQPHVSAPQADLDRLGVAFSVSTHHDPPPRPSMTLREAQRDPRAFLVGFAQTERSVDFERELARRTWAAGRGVHADARHDWMAAAAPVERFGRALCEQRRLGTDTRWAALLKHVLGRSKPVASVSAEDEDAFDLTTIVAALRITPEKHVYLSWEPGRGEVDRLAFQDLADRFAWIWYASSAWLLFVHHSGKPSVVQWGG